MHDKFCLYFALPPKLNCYDLNVCAPLNSYVGILNSELVVLRTEVWVSGWIMRL